ncbi:hypothetical protein KCU89_g17, partial [Aureobasidium melanogenum]
MGVQTSRLGDMVDIIRRIARPVNTSPRKQRVRILNRGATSRSRVTMLTCDPPTYQLAFCHAHAAKALHEGHRSIQSIQSIHSLSVRYIVSLVFTTPHTCFTLLDAPLNQYKSRDSQSHRKQLAMIGATGWPKTGSSGILLSKSRRHFLQTHSSSNYGVHLRLFPIHLTMYTRPSRTGTSISGPTVDANAWSLSAPYVATATAIASSKLLLAAVKLCVEASLYPKPRRCDIQSVKVKITKKYTIRGAATRTTDTI